MSPLLISILIGCFENVNGVKEYKQYYLDTILATALGTYTFYGEDFYCIKLRPHTPGIDAGFYARCYPKFPGGINPSSVVKSLPALVAQGGGD